MSTTIVFTDTTGTVTLANGKPAPADRFASWVPLSRDFGDSVPRMSDGAITMFVYRTDYGASFELRHIPIAAVGGVRLVEIADRLIRHLLRGGTCIVNTGDAASSSYATCGLMPGTTPTLSQSSASLLEYTLSVSLINLAASPVAMICRYA